MSSKLTPTRRSLAIVAALVIGGAVAGGAFASAKSSSTPAKPQGGHPLSARLRQEVRLARALKARYGRRVDRSSKRSLMVTSGAARPLPKLVARHLRAFRDASRARAHAASEATSTPFPGASSSEVSQWGLAVGDAMAIPNSTGLQVWLVPGDSGSCLFWRYPDFSPVVADVGGCAPNSIVLTGDFFAIAPGPGSQTIIGVAPDGNTNVTLGLGDGSSESVPVSQNVYVAQATQGFRTVTLKDSTGAMRTNDVPGS